MWDRRHLPILVALCGSVALHLLTFGGVRHLKFGPARFGLEERSPHAETEVKISLSLLDSPISPIPPEDAVKPLKARSPEHLTDPQPTPVVPKPKPPQIKFPEEMGEASGKDVGSNKAEGIEPLHSREGDEDQALLSRNPGSGGAVRNTPAKWLSSPGENGRGGHPGSSMAGGAAGPPEQTPAAPAEPVALTVPAPQAHKRESEDAHVPEVPVPVVKTPSEKSADRTDPQSGLHAPPRESLSVAVAARVRSETASAIALAPVVMPLRHQQQQAYASDQPQDGFGNRGVSGDRPDDPPAVDGPLPRQVAHPTQTPGQSVEKPGTVLVPTPSAAPTRSPDASDPLPQRTLPHFALALAPVIPPPAPAVEPFREQRPEAHDIKPSAHPLDVKATPDQKPSPPAPVIPTGSPSVASAVRSAESSAQISHATGDGRQPGAAHPSSDPGQKSESESDAFSKIGSAIFRDGRLDVRFGRKITTVRPQIPIVGQIDSFAMRNPSVTLKVSIGPTGKVTNVLIDKSSGSNEIDQPCLLAMYDWWFEPLKDSRGLPLNDCVLFTIGFR